MSQDADFGTWHVIVRSNTGQDYTLGEITLPETNLIHESNPSKYYFHFAFTQYYFPTNAISEAGSDDLSDCKCDIDHYGVD